MEKDKIQEAYEITILNENKAKSVFSKWQKNKRNIEKALNDTVKDFEQMDNMIGGSTLIDPIKTSHEYLMLALSRFSQELFTATPMYGEELLRKGK